jgi:hypothetical protein
MGAGLEIVGFSIWFRGSLVKFTGSLLTSSIRGVSLLTNVSLLYEMYFAVYYHANRIILCEIKYTNVGFTNKKSKK